MHGPKEKALGRKTARCALFAYARGSQQETLGGRIGVSVGRGPSSSQSPYPSLSAYAESSLIPTLVLSPRKPLRWVFAGAPVLLKFSAVRPRRTAIVRRRVQDRFDLRFPSAAALPTSQRFILIFYPGSAKRSGERGKRRWSNPTTTHERSTHAPKCGEALLCSPRLKRTPVPASRFPPHRHQRPPSLSKPDRQGGIWTQKRFSFGPGAARFLWQDQRKWGVQTPSGKFLPNRV